MLLSAVTTTGLASNDCTAAPTCGPTATASGPPPRVEVTRVPTCWPISARTAASSASPVINWVMNVPTPAGTAGMDNNLLTKLETATPAAGARAGKSGG